MEWYELPDEYEKLVEEYTKLTGKSPFEPCTEPTPVRCTVCGKKVGELPPGYIDVDIHICKDCRNAKHERGTIGCAVNAIADWLEGR